MVNHHDPVAGADEFRLLLSAACRRLAIDGQPLMVALSGGADSVALFRGLLERLPPPAVAPAGFPAPASRLVVAHLNHGLRGDAAREDARWIAQLCHHWQVPLIADEIDVARLAVNSGAGIEETARNERYRFLARAAAEAGCACVAVAHNADDQAETIVHHLLRGTGLTGLTGMPHERCIGPDLRLVRPLLDIRRATILDYLAGIGQDFRTDATNADESYTRNRIRHRLLPLLAQDFNPQIVDALLRLGRQATDANAALSTAAEIILDRALVEADARHCRLKWQSVARYPRPLVREVFLALWRRQDWPRGQMSFSHWNDLAGVLEQGGAISLPGKIEARRRGHYLELTALRLRRGHPHAHGGGDT
jgi:tRNA(Ile)-lysidine synthase